jgi:protein TonB
MIPKPALLSVILLALAPSLVVAQTAANPWVAPPTLAAPAPATETPPQTPLAEFYPERAQRMEVEGDASIRCLVTTTGMLASCVVVSESPPGFNFGAATLHASHLWRVKPPRRDGVSVEGVITIPVRWRLGHNKPPITPPAER